MPLPLSRLNVTMNDHTVVNGKVENGSFGIYIDTISGANIVNSATQRAAFLTAIEALTIGVLAKTQVILTSEVVSSLPAASPLAQKENVWLCRYHNAVTFEKATFSIPTADLNFVDGNTEFVDLTQGAGLALKTAFEAVAVAPQSDSEGVVLDSVQFVGRS